jgi:hypothetical protein
MNRSDFLKTLLGATAVACAAPGKGGRRVTASDYELRAKPEVIFPLLCPVREYEWIDGWTSNLVYSKSGVAEQDCVFTTSYLGEPMTWTCCRYEPPRRIEYVAVAQDLMLMHLTIQLEPAGAGTRMYWKRAFTRLSPRGEHPLDSWSTEKEQHLGEQLRYFVETGKLLRDARS